MKLSLAKYAALYFLFIIPLSLNALGFEFLHGGAYGIGSFQSRNAKSFSGLVMWSPSFSLTRVSLIADLGSTYLSTQDRHHFGLHFAGRVKVTLLADIAVDATAGVQNWTKEAGTFGVYGGGISYGWIRLAAQYIANSAFPTWQVLLGLDI